MKKSRIEKIVAELPDDVDIDALIEQLRLLDSLERAEQEIASGKGIEHVAAKRMLARWLY
ncbi:MAG: hypothetical protein KDA85_17640 [Planctomycetaceae bacterium]|nr:hypothetical protein [Planctomycetaceae bacterium]